jgi:Putative auto-transporter adhesin, head GIN domain
MKPVFRFASPVALMLACVALAAAAQHHETRPLSGYHAVSLAAPIRLDLVQGDAESVALDGDDAAVAEIETVVEDGILKIRNKSYFTNANLSKVVAHVSVKNLDALSTKGSGDIRTGALKGRELKLSVSGSGDIRIETLSATDLSVSIAGSGDVFIAGKVDNVSTSIAGSGDMKAAKLESRESHISIAGSGDALLWVHDTIDVSIMGSGDVRYYGDAKVKSSVMGSGSVKRVSASPS